MSRLLDEPDTLTQAPPVEQATLRDTAAGIARNTSTLLFQQVITMTSSIVLTLFLARLLGPVEYGKLYLAAAISGIFQILVSYGGNYLIAKQVARERARTGVIFINALLLRLAFAVLSLLMIWGLAFLLDYPSDVRMLLTIYGIGLAVWAVHISLYACYQGHELLQYTSAGAVAERVFVSVVAVVALLLGAGVIPIAIITLLGTVANVLTELWFSHKILHVVPRFDGRIIREELKAGVPYFLFGICSMIYFRIGAVMLERMTPSAVVGWFGAAFRFFESLNFPYVLTIAIYPVLARSWVEISEVHRRTMQRSLEYVIALGIPVAIGGGLFAREIVGIFYGMPAFEPSAAVLAILCAGLPFLYVDMILGTTLLSSDRQKSMVVISIVAIPVNLGLNYFLIPYTQARWANGGLGTGAATVVTELFIMLSMLSILPKGVLRGFRKSVPAKSAVAGVCMAVAVMIVRAAGLPWIVAAAVSILVFAGAILLLKAFDASEKALLRELVVERGIRRLLLVFNRVRPRGEESAFVEPAPALSVGLPVYNGEKYVAQAIESILAQSFEDFELIISDNGSTDRTREICEAFAERDARIRYVRNKRNLGVAANYNNTVKLARGEYFKWATYDDLTGPGFFEKCLEVLRREPDVALCYPGTLIVDENGLPLRYPETSFDFRSQRSHVRFAGALAALRDYECEALYGVMRRSYLQQTGLIQNYHSSDRVLLAELTLQGKTYELPDRLFHHRIHPEISTRPGQTARQLASWFNPDRKGKFVFARTRRFFEFFKAVNRARLPFLGRAYCYSHILWFYMSSDKWARLFRRMNPLARGANVLNARPTIVAVGGSTIEVGNSRSNLMENAGNAAKASRFERYHIPLLLVIALAVRLALILTTSTPILAWRPTDLASIALNYFRNGFHFLHPQVFWGGDGPGYVEMEFPLLPFLTACLYRVLGFHQWVALIIPVFVGLATPVLMYLFTRYLFGAPAALVAGLITAVSPPLALLTVSLWPDPPMVMFGVLGLYALTRWAKAGGNGSFLLGAAAVSMAILLKLTALFLGFPILYLCFQRYGMAAWKTPKVWLLAVLILLPPLLWYWHSHSLFVQYHNTFGILSSGYLKFGTASILLDPKFYIGMIWKIALFHLTPLAFLFFLWSLFVRGKSNSPITLAWIGGVVVYFLVAARGVELGHYQYAVPIVPAMAPLAGVGAVDLFKKVRARIPAIATARVRTAAIGVCLVYVAGCVAMAGMYRSKAWYMWENDRKTGLEVARVTHPGSLIVVVDNDQDEVPPEKSMTPPMVFYVSDRKGWYESMAWLNINRVEDLRNRGARYLIVTGNGLAAFDSSFRELKTQISGRYRTVLDNSDGMVFDLTGTM